MTASLLKTGVTVKLKENIQVPFFFTKFSLFLFKMINDGVMWSKVTVTT